MRGFIFRCSSHTSAEVYKRNLFGEKSNYLELVKNISEADYLFLYNTSTFEFSGPFLPLGHGAKNIVPEAWEGKFPAQVNFRMGRKTKTIQYSEIEHLINRFNNKIHPYMELGSKQVDEIMQIIEK
ncbi:hypothetical protein KBD45_05965 [Candidatus Dojkabacteria bacterium]|nr:hypothetical protein [Candidatus Dojkabacteria bacterium]